MLASPGLICLQKSSNMAVLGFPYPYFCSNGPYIIFKQKPPDVGNLNFTARRPPLGKINDQLPEFGIGYFADIEQVGNGYVTEAVSALVKELFEAAEIHRIQIETDDSNIRSIGVAERCGFLREGHLRKNKRALDGSYTGTLFFGLLKEEYSV